MYYIYDTLVNVRSVLLHGQPLSMVRLKQGDTVVVVRFGRNCKCKAVTVKLTYSKHIINLNSKTSLAKKARQMNDLLLFFRYMPMSQRPGQVSRVLFYVN